MKRIIILSGLSLVLFGCTQSKPAEIVDLTDPTSFTGGISTTYITPPKNISLMGTTLSNTNLSADSTSNGTSSISSAMEDRSSKVSSINSTKLTAEDSQSSQDVQTSYSRNYDEIPKGGYKDNFYTVKRGDTLFYIAWVTGNDYRALAAKNNIPEPYALREGQILNVGTGEAVIVTEKKVATAQKNSQVLTNSSAPKSLTPPKASNSAKQSTDKLSIVDNIGWLWPAKGNIIARYSKETKGIDISGSLGDDVLSAAEGKVVYAGNALPGYGNLIIIKHNDDYLTAYAHNQTMLVKEQQSVKAGQKIATMGATGTSSVRLHFEIRYRAKSVDPQKYLPAR